MRNWRDKKSSWERRCVVRSLTGREERARSVARVDCVVGVAGLRVALKSGMLACFAGGFSFLSYFCVGEGGLSLFSLKIGSNCSCGRCRALAHLALVILVINVIVPRSVCVVGGKAIQSRP